MFVRHSILLHGCVCIYIPDDKISKKIIIQSSFSKIGEGNGNLLQYSCLENSMNRGAVWAAVHGVAKHQTQLSTDTERKIINKQAHSVW